MAGDNAKRSFGSTFMTGLKQAAVEAAFGRDPQLVSTPQGGPAA